MTEKRENACMWQDRKHHLWFPFSFTKYYITNDRLMVKEGLFTTTINETLLYRIVDLGFRQTLAGRRYHCKSKSRCHAGDYPKKYQESGKCA